MINRLLREAFSAIRLGVIVLDAQHRVVVWNDWFATHTGLAAADVAGMDFFAVFPELLQHRVGAAVRQAIDSKLPAILSQSLHRAPFPLYADPRAPGERLQQAVVITPLGDAERHCLIQVDDVSTAVRRESLLREQAHVLLSQSLSDGLTGVGNRRHFDLAFDKEWRASKRSGKPLSLLMIDVDYFKAYNDCYGHQQGDACLRQIATALQQALRRPGDMLFRYGGEEFCAVLPDTWQDDALQVAEALRANVQRLALPHAAAAGATVSVSLGVATQCARAQVDPAVLLVAADAALYDAKRGGRNRVAADAIA